MIDQVFFLDFENVQKVDLSLISGKTKIYLMSGKVQTKSAIEYATKIADSCSSIEIIKIKEPGPNALDFHIAYFLGRITFQAANKKYLIFSNDKGYDSLIRYLKDEGIKIERKEVKKENEENELKVEAKEKTVKKTETPQKTQPISNLKAKVKEKQNSPYDNAYAHFIEMPKKNRPKKEDGLKAFIKTALGNKESDSVVNEIFNTFIKKNIISIENEKVKYNV